MNSLDRTDTEIVFYISYSYMRNTYLGEHEKALNKDLYKVSPTRATCQTIFVERFEKSSESNLILSQYFYVGDF